MSWFVHGREADGKFQVIDLDDVWVSVMGARELSQPRATVVLLKRVNKYAANTVLREKEGDPYERKALRSISQLARPLFWGSGGLMSCR